MEACGMRATGKLETGFRFTLGRWKSLITHVHVLWGLRASRDTDGRHFQEHKFVVRQGDHME